ncbi:snoRNA binding protein-like protein [Stipitochalara longipes BDJ]|nr:snoRNA binding protein-like protein [Stipitochalara longipes BDJ]
MAKRNWARSCYGILQSILIAIGVYGFLYLAVILFQRGSIPRSPQELLRRPSSQWSGSSSSDNVGHSSNVRLPSPRLRVDKINPDANWFNRPESLVVPRDDYMGNRPHVDTVANSTMLVEECRGSYKRIERMPYVYDCLKYLEESEKEYFFLPPKEERASEQPPRKAEYLNSDGKDNTLGEYPSFKAASEHSTGKCNGPIVPYHVYWTGPATWRVELFVKSHLYTQNIPCVRLWIWLDGDRDPKAVDKMLNDDLQFKKFLPLVERGDILLKLWRFPRRIPLPPGDNTDGKGYYKTPRKSSSNNETLVADGLIRDEKDQEWLVLNEKQMTFLPVAVSDAVRFVVLHLYGGAYFDMDVIMLRDMRPLLIGKEHSFAERWGGHPTPGDYNTAIMSLTANSSLSSYLLRGGVRMGLNFHPRVIGVMAVKDKRNHEFQMLETAVFDPIWTEFNWDRKGLCTVPCIHDYGQVFKARNAFPLKDEWESYDDEPLTLISETKKDAGHSGEVRSKQVEEKELPEKIAKMETYNRDALSKAEYKIELDRYPPTNRTLEHFFRGAWTYHVHNQWRKNPEPSSWLNVLQRAQDGFFSHSRMNPYGERWEGPTIEEYEPSWEFA